MLRLKDVGKEEWMRLSIGKMAHKTSKEIKYGIEKILSSEKYFSKC